jgi:hypothetical protein
MTGSVCCLGLISNMFGDSIRSLCQEDPSDQSRNFKTGDGNCVLLLLLRFVFDTNAVKPFKE